MKLDGLPGRYAGHHSARLIDIGLDGSRRDISYPDLDARVQAKVAELTRAGLKPGHVIGIQARNSIEWVIWDLAALELGAYLYALPDSVEADEQFVADEGLFALVSDSAPAEATGPLLAPADVLDGRLLDRSAPRQTAPDLHSFTFSSGTAGSLKGLRISRSGTECVISRFINAFRITAADRHLIFLPMSNYQQRLSVYCCLWAGVDLVLAPYQRIFSALPAEQPTFLIAPPVFYDSVLQLHRKTGRQRSLASFLGGRIRFMITGMAPIRRATLDTFWAADLQLLEAYGLTETGMITWNTPDTHRVGTVGRLIDPASVQFTVDGELIIKSATPLSLGYFKTPEGDAQTFGTDGSIATGDFGTLDADGFLSLRGRRNDVIALGSGHKVNPAEIEALFAEAVGTGELVVVSPGSTGRLGAVVSLPAGSGTDDRDDVRAIIGKINARLPDYQRISSIVFADGPLAADPRFQTANFKLRRSAVSAHFTEMAAEGGTALPVSGREE